MDRFRLERSTKQENGWVLTDTENMIVVTFEEHKFNDTQKVTLLDGNDVASMDEAMKRVRALREMADWLSINHYNIAM